MSDHVTTPYGKLATDEVTQPDGVLAHSQRAKLQFGAEGSVTDVGLTTPMPTSAAPRTDVVQNGSSQLTPKYKVIDHAASGDNEIVAAVANKKIRVLSAVLVMTGTAVTIRFESAAGGTALTGQMTPLQGHSINFPFNPLGHFETIAGQALNMELGGAQSVDGCLTYVEV